MTERDQVFEEIPWHPISSDSGWIDLDKYPKGSIFRSTDKDGVEYVELYPPCGGYLKFKLKDCVWSDVGPFHG